MNFVSIVHAYVYVHFPPVIKNPRDDLLNTFAHQYSTNNTNLYVQHWSDFIFFLYFLVFRGLFYIVSIIINSQ